VHAALVPGHAAAQPRLAAAFVTAAVAAVGAAAALAAGRGGAAVLVLGLSLAAYAVDRSVELPLLSEVHVHHGADVLGLATKALEAVGLWGAIVTVSARSGPVALLDSPG